MTEDRQHAILIAFATVFAGIDVRQIEPQAAFDRLAGQVPDLTPGELSAVADLAKTVSSEMRSLSHRVERERENERRRSGTR